MTRTLYAENAMNAVIPTRPAITALTAFIAYRRRVK